MTEIYPDDFIMSPKVDFAFKEIMANPMVRKGFISAVLNIKDTDIKETILENTNLRVMHESEKLSILDVRLLMNDDTEINIEIQLTYYKTWSKRAAFYLAKMLAEQTGINKIYSNIKKCIGINILDFKYTEDNEFYKSYHIREDKSNEIFTDILEWHIIELPKLPAEDSNTSLYNWTKFIKSENREELEMIAKKDVYINEAFKQLEIISQDREKQIAYTSRQKALMDYNTIMEERYETGMQVGIEKGLKAGRKEGRQEGIQVGRKEGIKEGIQVGRKEGRQEILNQLIALGVKIPDKMIEDIEY